MIPADRKINLVLSGGGIKGIAYIGAFSVLEANEYTISNIAGVSAGALAGTFICAGYTSKELKQIMYSFDFSGIDLSRIDAEVPVLSRYREFLETKRYYGIGSVHYFLSGNDNSRLNGENGRAHMPDIIGKILKNILTFSKEGCLFDGDYLEEWVYKTLQKKGIRNFGDLRTGVPDNKNPHGYKVRMTAVDATRNRILTLPDDISFYGIKPDNLSVAKAVRMSTCVPFAFKPVEIACWEGGKKKVYNIIDGGVFDNFPYWLIDSSQYSRTLGFKLSEDKKKLLGLSTPVALYKKLVSSVQDLGVPNKKHMLKNIGIINTSDISFLDFNISDREKNYLFTAGKKSAQEILNKMKRGNKDLHWDKTGVYSLFCTFLKRVFNG